MASGLWAAGVSSAAAACSTANPPAGVPASEPVGFTPGVYSEPPDKTIEAIFNTARATQGCPALVLPATYDGLSYQEKVLWLVNSEREIRAMRPLKLDSTLLSQIALNHSREMASYGYENHNSPIFPLATRRSVDPTLEAPGFAENISFVFPASLGVYTWIYNDEASQWGHRMNALNPSFNWVGIGAVFAAGSKNENYFTADFINQSTYQPPAAADTGAPVLGPVTYANGTASVSGVAESPQNRNYKAPNPATVGIARVVFYTNSIVELESGGRLEGKYNTVAATETAPGTWTAPMTVNAGEVLHAVAVDGSGNFTDSAPPPPPTVMKQGENTVALPVETTATPAEAPEEEFTGPPPTMALIAARPHHSNGVRAITPTAAALVHSIDHQLGQGTVRYVRVYVSGHWRTYRPGKSQSFALYVGEGVDVNVRHAGRWRSSTAAVKYYAPHLRLHRGWNFVSVPYPIVHMTCHATRLELARLGDKLEELSVGPRPGVGFVMRPNKKGEWGNDLKKVLPVGKGFWVKDAAGATWTPNPVAYGPRYSGAA
jgi:uncharacterized protein YkwD